MDIANPFELILDKLNVIQTKVGDIDTIVRSGNIPPIRKPKKSKIKEPEIKEEVLNG